MKTEQCITDAVAKAVAALYGAADAGAQIQLKRTRREFEGSFTLVVFPLLGISHKKPEETAAEIGSFLAENCPDVAAYNVANGFLNLTVSAESRIRTLRAVDTDPSYGIRKPEDGAPLWMIEYSSPNTNKPLHLGHLRNILLGWALASIEEACGRRVVKTNIVNDRGIHICKSMLAWLKYCNGATPRSSGKKGDHFVGDCYVLFERNRREQARKLAGQYAAQGASEEEAARKAGDDAPLMREAHEMLVKWERGDEDVRALWRKMNEWVYEGFNETYRALGVGFDKIYYESDTYLAGKAIVESGLEKGVFFRKDDGSVWARLDGEGLDDKLLLRADGTSVYMTQDLGTAQLRYRDFPIEKMIYVVGNEQDYHFKVLSILLDRLGFEWGKSLVHFSYGMVALPNGRMKSREGTVVDADDLIEEMTLTARQTSDELGKFTDIPESEKDETARIVGLGALKYFLLKVDAKKNMLFNPEESIDFNGNTGPFIQYTYARIRSVLRKAAGQGVGAYDVPEGTDVNGKEASLIQLLEDFDGAVRQAGDDMNPSVIANYCYSLVKEYNQFYHDYPILREENAGKKHLRLMLSANVAKIVRSGMRLLGIEMPERM